MKLITRDTDYAIRAICRMAGKAELVSAADLVREFHMPRPFIRKILQTLSSSKVIESQKGIGGGFRLLKNPKDIRVLDVVEIFQGEFRLNECFFKRRLCPNRKKCALKKKIDGIELSVMRELAATTISSLIE